MVVTARPLPHIVVAGPRVLVVPRHIAALGDSLGYARALQRVAATRWDVLVAWLAWPWDRVATAAGWIARNVGSLALVGWAWSIRWLVAGIAVIQSAVAGRFVSSVIIAVVVGLTYWMPWSRARWLHAAHAATLELMPPTDHRDLVSVGHSNRSTPTGARHHNQAIGMPGQRWHDRHEEIARHASTQLQKAAPRLAGERLAPS